MNREVDFDDYLEAEVMDEDGKLAGTLECYWTGDQGETQLLGVRTKRSGNRTAVVPVALAAASERESCVVLRLQAAKLAQAPHLDCDQSITPQLEERVYSFFDLDLPERRENVRIHRAEHAK